MSNSSLCKRTQRLRLLVSYSGLHTTVLMKPLLPKFSFIPRPMSRNDIKSVNCPFFFHFNLFSGHIEFSSEVFRKHFGDSYASILRKVRHPEKKRFFKENCQKCSFGLVDCGSQLCRKSLTEIEKNRVFFKFTFSFRVFPSTPTKQV